MRNINVVALAVLFAFGACAGQKDSVPAVRNRPVISKDGHTFVADDGYLLRGAYWSTDWSGELPSRSYFATLRKLGLNTLHVYGESFAAGKPAGMYKGQIDELVKWSREEGFYLVLTIGNLDKNGMYDLDFAMEFWKIYAPRYANELHVLYEIQNEPFAWQAGYPADVLKMETDLYGLIRTLAPNTPVLLMSYARFETAKDVLIDLYKIADKVDFANAAVAFHGYSDAEETRKTLDLVQAAGFPCVNTEFAVLDDDYQVVSVEPQTLKLCEEYGVSWLVFLTDRQINRPSMFSDILKKNKIRWNF
jgi:hypothetical protein